MSEIRTTAVFVGVALALVVVTWATAPRLTPPAVFAERGDLLFPQFRDPNAAASLEVTQFDSRNAIVRPFKVQNRNGRWTIPSQHDYPADAKDRLAQTAAAIIALKKDDVATDNAADYERCGVLDPLDATLPSLNGRGTRLLVRGARDEVLADVIVGGTVETHPGYRYVRVPSQKRVYISNVGDLKISTAFGDWIDRDLLQINVSDIDAVNLRNYSLDRSTGRVNPGETLLLQKTKSDDWTINGLADTEQLSVGAVDGLLRSLAALRITGVLPKPAGISATLSRAVNSASITAPDQADLVRKGFYLASSGQLVSNRGEVVVRTTKGVFYTLRFGDIAPSTETAAADEATPKADASAPAGSQESRYLFIMAEFDAGSARTPAQAAEGAQKVQLLRARFAPWYYVIGADSFAKIRLQRSALVKPKSAGRRG